MLGEVYISKSGYVNQRISLILALENVSYNQDISLCV